MLDQIRVLCQEQRLASLVLPRFADILQCRFVSAAEDHFYLELLSNVSLNQSLFPGSGTVIFSSENRSRLFVSQVFEIRNASGSFPQLKLSIPQEIIAAEGRRSFRVPLDPQTSLAVTIRAEDHEWTARPVDISLGGILLEFPEGTVPELWDYDELSVRLDINNHHTDLAGFPGRKEGKRFAIYFSDALRELRSGPEKVPAVLGEIVEELEREWLLKRVRKLE